MIQLYQKKTDCCGCNSCVQICPKSAIFMEKDEYGFTYPFINPDLCVECGLCQFVCNYKQPENVSLKETYAAASVSTDLSASASGGIFASIASAFLQMGGYVFGCAMQFDGDALQPKHICVTKLEDLRKLQGSKYVQSDINNTYKQTKSILDQNKLVLYSGTPCQISGLYGYLKKDYNNLYTIDIVCHGVPGQRFWSDYLSYIEAKTGKKVVDFKFRDKSHGWQLYGAMDLMSADGQKETVYFEPEKSSYYQMFLNSYTYRENCYSCPFAGEYRSGNISIGDFWCIDIVRPELIKENGGPLNQQSGISCMIINNEKGRQLLEVAGSGIQRYPSTYEEAAKYNGQLLHPSTLKKERKNVLKLYAGSGYDAVDKWYQKRLQRIRMKRTLRRMVPKSLKKLYRKLLKVLYL